jgi:hypothetical protein
VPRLSRLPIAVAADGTVYANLLHLGQTGTMKKRLQRLRLPGEIFVGVSLTRGELRDLLMATDNALAEAIARIAWQRRHASKTKK